MSEINFDIPPVDKVHTIDYSHLDNQCNLSPLVPNTPLMHEALMLANIYIYKMSKKDKVKGTREEGVHFSCTRERVRKKNRAKKLYTAKQKLDAKEWLLDGSYNVHPRHAYKYIYIYTRTPLCTSQRRGLRQG